MFSSVSCPACGQIFLAPKKPGARLMCAHCAHSGWENDFILVDLMSRQAAQTILPTRNAQRIEADSDREEQQLLAFFADTPESDSPEEGEANPWAVFEEESKPQEILSEKSPTPVSKPTRSALPYVREVEILEPEPYPMAWSSDLESSWTSAKPMSKRMEKWILTGAIYLAAALTMGAFIFMQIDTSVAASRAAEDSVAVASARTHVRQVEEDKQASLARAKQALSRPTWTELLPFVRDARVLLPEIRDYYKKWPYRPVERPDLTYIKRVEQDERVFVHLKLDAGQPWSRLVILEKIAGEFRLDWEAFQRLHSAEFQSEIGDPLQDDYLELKLEELRQDGNAFLASPGLPELQPEPNISLH